MLAEQSLREGKLQETLTKLQEQVRKDPSNSKHRVFLFQLLAVMGQWDRSINQLNVAGDMDPGTLAMVQTYREALRCEVFRAEVFNGKHSPLIFGDPEEWVALVIEALRLTADEKYTQSQQVRNKAFEAAPISSGTIDDKPFEWIADADSRLGPVLEVIVNGRYYWVPFHRISAIHIEEPVDLRDFVWMPAYFTWANGGETVGFIPTRYPGSQNCEDSQLCMGRKTEWTEHEGGQFIGLGQRLLATNEGEYPLMDIRKIVLNNSIGASEPNEK